MMMSGREAILLENTLRFHREVAIDPYQDSQQDLIRM
jgi:hypothetical protein